MNAGKSLRLPGLAVLVAAGMAIAGGAAAQDVSLNYERLSSMEEPLAAEIGGVTVFRDGGRTAFEEGYVRGLLGRDPVDVAVDLGVGAGEARAWGCDLTPGYITENVAYYSS